MSQRKKPLKNISDIDDDFLEENIDKINDDVTQHLFEISDMVKEFDKFIAKHIDEINDIKLRGILKQANKINKDFKRINETVGKQIEIIEVEEEKLSLNQIRLREVVFRNSKNKIDWDKAKSEWKLQRVEWGKDDCICGKKGITQLCIIYNEDTEKSLIIGSSCIGQFLLNISESGIDSLEKISKDTSGKTASVELVDSAVKLNILSSSAGEFYKEMTAKVGSRKHFDPNHIKFSQKKYDIRENYNKAIIIGFTVSRPRCRHGYPMMVYVQNGEFKWTCPEPSFYDKCRVEKKFTPDEYL